MRTKKLMMAAAMVVFGSIGLFVRRIPLTSAQISLLRGIAGCLCLALAAPRCGGFSWRHVRDNAGWLLVAGSFMGVQWILFFEALRWTTVAAGTICYYLAPAFLLALAPFMLGESFKRSTAVCIAVSLAGLACIAAGGGGAGKNDVLGITCGVLAALGYAVAIVANKRLRGITPLESTIADLFVAAAFLAPYVLLTDGISFAGLDGTGWLCLATLCFFHTGAAYLMYFAALRALPARTTAALSYIDPLSAVLFSFAVLGESISPLQWLGGALILGATFVNEMRGGEGA